MTFIKDKSAEAPSPRGVKAQYGTQPAALPDSSLLEWLRQFYNTTCPLPESFRATRNDWPPQKRGIMNA